MRTKFIEALKPCCSLPYLLLREFVLSLALWNEIDRKKILKEIQIDGTITRKGWILLLNNIDSDTLDLTELREEWLGDCYSLNCEQWERFLNEIKFKEDITTGLFLLKVGDLMKPTAKKLVQLISGFDAFKARDLVDGGYPVLIKPNVRENDWFYNEDVYLDFGEDNGVDLGGITIDKQTSYRGLINIANTFPIHFEIQ